MLDGKDKSTTSGSVKMNENPGAKQDVVKASAEARRKVNMTPFFITDSQKYERGFCILFGSSWSRVRLRSRAYR
jgi:hypothetical protein